MNLPAVLILLARLASAQEPPASSTAPATLPAPPPVAAPAAQASTAPRAGYARGTAQEENGGATAPRAGYARGTAREENGGATAPRAGYARGTAREENGGATAPAPGSVRLLSIGSYQAAGAMPQLVPFERLLADRQADLELVDVENVPAYFNGGSYRYRLPETMDLDAPPSTGVARVAAVESEYGFFLLWPADPALMAEALDSFRRPERYRRPMSPRVIEREASVLVAPAAEGGWVHSATIETPRQTASQWRNTVATAYRLRARGRRVEAVFIQKTLGGLGRLATALSEERAAAPALVVSRGSQFARDGEALDGRGWFEALERMGLAVSAIGLGELRLWDQLVAYRGSSLEPIQFVSANLVWSSSPDTPALPPFVVREVGGVRVGFIGLTRPAYAKYLAAGRWKSLTVADPVGAVVGRIQALREKADLVVALSNLDEAELFRVKSAVRGIDVFLSDDEPFLPVASEPKRVSVAERVRSTFAPALLTATEFRASLTRLEADLGPRQPDGTRSLAAQTSYRVLDESLADDPAFPERSVEAYGVATDTRPALIPSARRLWPQGSRDSLGLPTLSARDFWTLAAAVATERAGAELGVMPVFPISVRTTGDYREGQVEDWFFWEDRLLAFELRGSEVSKLLALAREGASREARGSPPAEGEMRIAVSGATPDGLVHGAPIQPDAVYRVVGTELLLGNAEQAPPLEQATVVDSYGTVRDEILAGLRRGAEARWGVDRYRSLIEGAPFKETGVWRVHFRDVSANVTNTHVVKDAAAFAQVPNSRVQGFDQQVVGVTLKTDADYAFHDYRWSNSLSLEYSRARLRPPNQPEIVNTPNNRLGAQTTGTRRVGGVPWSWLARSYGPSLGAEYEGQVENTPGLRRKEVYSVLPGVELFDGTVVQTLQLSASVKKDFSRVVPNTQYGLRQRLVLSAPLKAARIQGELLTRYFFLTPQDAPEDLRLESNLQLKLLVPIYKNLTLAPFADLFVFQLKTRSDSGYSFITGISLGFSRLWKPGFERF